ncbi:uncharacterized protein LOC141666764 isoform X3 [Apium graveolens]|uniref:uncharacterized protein LOC141666764 isoform X3 n=1 Tax=Apium graveolens TaxID=4045 RepID=UPI003D797EC6
MYVYTTTTTPKLTIFNHSSCSFIPNFHFHFTFSNPNLNNYHQVIKRRYPLAVRASSSPQNGGTYDPELNYVLQLATGSELYELKQILFGKSYFSPLLKSIARPKDIDYFMVEQDPDERDDFIEMLESRFFFLAADARSTLRGWRPSYRNVLLSVRKKLKIPCSAKLKTEDLEVEIFLHLLQDYSSDEAGRITKSMTPDGQGSLELGLSQWKIQTVSALRAGALGLRSVILKGGGILTLGKLYKMGGHLATVNLESRVALLAAKQGVKGAALRYIGLRSMMTLFGPMLWGTLLADVVIQMLGTDYARILRAIYAIAQLMALVHESVHWYLLYHLLPEI